MEIQEESAVSDVTCQICNPEESRIEQQEQIESEDCATDQQYQNWQSQNQNDPMTCQICNFQKYQFLLWNLATKWIGAIKTSIYIYVP